MKIFVINGANINFLGIREQSVYGNANYEALVDTIKKHATKNNVDVEVMQSNHEGVIIDWIQQAYHDNVDGIIINPGAYTHTSIAIMDAIKSIAPIPCIEVHLSDISAREEFRHLSYTALACVKQISGMGIDGYILAVDELLEISRDVDNK